MNLLDENIPDIQRRLIQNRHLPVYQIGVDIATKGIKDQAIISLLHALGRPTFFTQDHAFYRRALCHPEYCLVHLDVQEDEVADFVLRTLRHAELNTRAKRMGTVVRVAPERISLWRLRVQKQLHFDW
jgi:hypothetical protein